MTKPEAGAWLPSTTTGRTDMTDTTQVTQALEYSRMADPEAWANADAGKHSRENNIRLAQANIVGKARYLFELLAGLSQSQFVEVAASEDGENLLNVLVGVLGESARHRTQALADHRALVEALEVFRSFGCPVCNGDCSGANPPVMTCPMQMADRALVAKATGDRP